MSYNGSGTFQINTSGQPVVTGTSISSTVFNALTADLATGLSTAITKDGQTTTTARIPFALGINSTLVTDATNTTSGSIITAGGVGIAKALFVGTTANVAGLTASSAVATDASKNLVSVTNTGTGNNVLATGPTISGPTISDGTANGVAYLNGSKVLTTGSALVFDGTNLGIGTTSPSQRLEVSGGDAKITAAGNGTRNLFFGTSATNYQTIKYDDATGALTIGSIASAYPVVFQTQGAERARIDSSGNLLVGATSTSFSEKFNSTQSANQKAGLFFNTNASFTNYVVNLRASRNTTNGSYGFLQCSIDGVADKLYIADSGNVTNTNNSYGPISDVKLKENIVDATPKLQDLMQVRIVNYNLKAELGYESHKQIGVVAQELEQVFAGLVDEKVDRDAEGNDLGTTTKSVKMSVFTPMLIKAIQEQQALITTLTARITALEGA